MNALRALTVRSVALCVALAAGVGLLGGLVRLLPWIISPRIGWGPSVPFARLIVSTALEAALMVGCPTGFALGAALFVERGEFRALAALGASPLRMCRSVLVPLLAVFSLAAAAPRVAPALSPGRFVDGVIASARAGCDESGRTQRDVPLIDASWLCFPSGPRFVGRLPATSSTWFSAASVRVSDDARRVDLSDLHVSASSTDDVLRLHVERAAVLGLPGWGPGKRLSGGPRGLLLAAALLALSLFVTERTLAWSLTPLAAGLAALLASIGAFQVLRALDSGHGVFSGYALVPAAGAAIFVAVSTAVRRLRGPRIARVTPG